ncbi:hypothetical protein ACOMHN_037804 [Nucella lapillus]
MEVFAKRIPDLNLTDLVCNPGLPNTSTNTQILKDDVWFSGRQPTEVDPQLPLSSHYLDSFGGQQIFVADRSLTDKLHKDGGGQTEHFLGHPYNGLPRRLGKNV